MSKRLHTLRVLLLLCMAAAGLVIWQGIDGWYSRLMQNQAQNEIAWSFSQGKFLGATFYLGLDRPTGQTGALLTFGLQRLSRGQTLYSHTAGEEAWQQSGPARYVLFVPGLARSLGLRVQFEGELFLDGQPLVSGQKLELSPGEHLLGSAEGEWPFTAVYGSRLPCMFVETETGSLDRLHSDKRPPDGAGFTLLGEDGRPENSGWISGMRGRGNTSWALTDKKSYNLSLAESQSMLGMSRVRQWALLANAFDKSLLRNQFVFALAQRVGMPYTPRSRQVELYINGEYRGCYLLCEKIQADKDRVDIPDTDALNQLAMAGIHASWPERLTQYAKGEPGLPGYQRYIRLAAEPETASCGFLFEIESPYRYINSANAGFISANGMAVSLKTPSQATLRQVEYLADIYQRLEDILYLREGQDPPEPLGQVVDLHSFAQKYLLEEIVSNFDANQSSQFFYKCPDSVSSKLFAGPVWDYDLSLGTRFDADMSPAWLASPEGYMANKTGYYPLWPGVCRQPDFQREMRTVFANEFVPVVGQMLGEGWITSRARRLADSAAMDALRWQGGDYDPETFPEEYLAEAEKIEEFLTARMAWLKSEWQAGK